MTILEKAAAGLEHLIAASKGGNVPGITEDHRFEMMDGLKALRDSGRTRLEAADLIQRVLAAYGSQRDDINDSDLDNEQPIALSVHLTLGQIRKARHFVISIGMRPADFQTRSPEVP